MVWMDQRSQGNDVLISFAKVQHLERALSLSGRLRQKNFSFYENFYDSARREVDAVVLGDIVDGVRG